MDKNSATSSELVSTGNAELDFILGGGLSTHSFYLVEGDPGAGKTTLALGFALDAVRRGEPVLYLALSETKPDLIRIAESHGWDLDGIEIADLSPDESQLSADAQSTMYHPSEIELGEVTKQILDQVERSDARRVIVDSLSEIRHLSQSELRYRRQLIALRSFFRGRASTVLLMDDRRDSVDYQLQSVARGTISLERHSPDYGRIRRRLQITKMRGHNIRTGYHDFIIRRGGLEIFPRLVASEHRQDFEHAAFSSGIAELDSLLGDGVQRGTSTLVMGAAGTGKSSLCSQYAAAAADQGEKTAIYVFDETAGNFLTRCDGLGIPVREHRDAGRLVLKQVDSAELSPGEFAWAIRRIVEQDGVSLVVLDSLNGYFNSMPNEVYLQGQIHELLSYLSQLGVTVLITLSQSGLVGSGVESPLETSYLADAIVLLRYFEHAGEVRKAISVVKKRTGGHETAIRELAFSRNGLRVGEPLKEFQGVLTGEPQYLGGPDPLFGR